VRNYNAYQRDALIGIEQYKIREIRGLGDLFNIEMEELLSDLQTTNLCTEYIRSNKRLLPVCTAYDSGEEEQMNQELRKMEKKAKKSVKDVKKSEDEFVLPTTMDIKERKVLDSVCGFFLGQHRNTVVMKKVFDFLDSKHKKLLKQPYTKIQKAKRGRVYGQLMGYFYKYIADAIEKMENRKSAEERNKRPSTLSGKKLEPKVPILDWESDEEVGERVVREARESWERRETDEEKVLYKSI
jgi:hypothetical protein